MVKVEISERALKVLLKVASQHNDTCRAEESKFADHVQVGNEITRLHRTYIEGK